MELNTAEDYEKGTLKTQFFFVLRPELAFLKPEAAPRGPRTDVIMSSASSAAQFLFRALSALITMRV